MLLFRIRSHHLLRSLRIVVTNKVPYATEGAQLTEFLLQVYDEETETEHWFAVGKPHFQAPGVAGRGTRGYVALPLDDNTGKPPLDDDGQPTKPFVYLKDAWRIDHPSLQKEGVVLQALNRANVKFVPTALYHGDLRGQDTLSYKNWSTLRGDEPCTLKPHQHYRLVVKEVGKPLSEFDRGADLVMAILNCIQAHEQACKAGYIHRDISAGNILLYKSKNGKWCGMLNDWELAAKYVMGQPVEVNAALAECPILERTGTWQFLSVNCLVNKQKTVDIPDDLESLFHVLLFFAVRFLPHNIKDEHVGLFLSQYFDDYSESYAGSSCGPSKYAAMYNGEINLTLLTNGSGTVVEGVAKVDLLKFYTSALTPTESGSAAPAAHPINALLSAVLEWFKSYYALGKLLDETPANMAQGDFVDFDEVADGDEDVLAAMQASDRDTTQSTAARTKVTSHAATADASASPAEPDDVATGPGDSKVRQAVQDAREKMTHRAFNMEFVKHTYRTQWPPSDKGADKRPRSFTRPKVVANAASAAAAVGSAQMNSTKRKQMKEEGSNAKRARNGPK
ncbi:hypothetical protein C8T65DRAFT_826720 [Cerioporus squamosus]|nr:hypothetical protein C8T65DRAFT_826720 [Cerioporus squamosus]